MNNRSHNKHPFQQQSLRHCVAETGCLNRSLSPTLATSQSDGWISSHSWHCRAHKLCYSYLMIGAFFFPYAGGLCADICGDYSADLSPDNCLEVGPPPLNPMHSFLITLRPKSEALFSSNSMSTYGPAHQASMQRVKVRNRKAAVRAQAKAKAIAKPKPKPRTQYSPGPNPVSKKLSSLTVSNQIRKARKNPPPPKPKFPKNPYKTPYGMWMRPKPDRSKRPPVVIKYDKIPTPCSTGKEK